MKATQGKWRGVYGEAQHAAFVYGWHLWRGGGQRRIKTDGGWYRITIPEPRRGYDLLAVAQQVFEVAAHEWVHIADYQHGGRYAMPFASRGPGGRRGLHDRRPKELRAINAVDEALDRGAILRHQDKIIALAVEMDRLGRAYTP